MLKNQPQINLPNDRDPQCPVRERAASYLAGRQVSGALPYHSAPYTIQIMPGFGIRRLAPFEEARRYHLYDDEGQLVMVADYKSPWLPQDAMRQVRFARPDGAPVATLDLPQTTLSNGRVVAEVNYAIIYDYAVYAIISEFNLPPQQAGGKSLYFTLEVEGKTWLVLPSNENDGVHALYNELPFGFNHRVRPEADELPEATGFIKENADGFDFVATVPLSKLRQRELVSIALVFLIDNRTLSNPAR